MEQRTCVVQKEGMGKKQSVSDFTWKNLKSLPAKSCNGGGFQTKKKIKMEMDAIVPNGDIGTNQ